ncbi:hypothetical protein SAMN05445060_3210 [Williamsia sterculiae]|uniref:Uncharacterized protein n=1 Tax=Williamsia sterculiae TaxID=1344003 RepID=A0A1N7GX52_9NOCA|nr:hypothetical protein SAMN05445060_3210 [Williamsia sterculiae]
MTRPADRMIRVVAAVAVTATAAPTTQVVDGQNPPTT